MAGQRICFPNKIIICFFVPWINIIGLGLSGFYLANNVINEEIGPIYVLYAIPILSIVSGCFNKKKLYLIFPILGIICIFMNTPYGENINYGKINSRKIFIHKVLK